ncbi:hypothetical protein Pan14r_14300 [Crateriforma conspicua]|uniref:Uncharacterized protein n=1 Tax=Crateriforma conspicua TaxID=2527996 RepID=A0A5C5Y093_9PLAN|nr:hypothetical protein Mal65_29110 [Crateriforma conspicua]TWT69146.1 hypothetical protein Pan14r_14300 [Crateriforma conspicua]
MVEPGHVDHSLCFCVPAGFCHYKLAWQYILSSDAEVPDATIRDHRSRFDAEAKGTDVNPVSQSRLIDWDK